MGTFARDIKEFGRPSEKDVVVGMGDKIKMHYCMRFVDTTVEETVKGKLTWIQVDNTKERREPLELPWVLGKSYGGSTKGWWVCVCTRRRNSSSDQPTGTGNAGRERSCHQERSCTTTLRY